MNVIKLPIAILFGAALATGLILACSDDAPQSADAAVCDCPAAEPPLTGRIVKVESSPVSLTPGGMTDGGANAGCPTGAVVLSGGCQQVGVSADFRVVLIEATPVTTPFQGFSCLWVNNDVGEHMVRAVAMCLMPPT